MDGLLQSAWPWLVGCARACGAEGDNDAVQTLGSAHVPGYASRLWRICDRCGRNEPVRVSLGRYRILQGIRRGRRTAAAGCGAAADWSLLSRHLSLGAYKSRGGAARLRRV